MACFLRLASLGKLSTLTFIGFIALSADLKGQDSHSVVGSVEFLSQLSPSASFPPCQLQEEGNISIDVPDIGDCSDPRSSTLQISPLKPVVILVHGINSPFNQFEHLSKEFQKQGIQPLCFRYNDRDSLDETALKLSHSVKVLKEQLGKNEITLFAYSLGTLLTRRSLVKEVEDSLAHEEDLKIDLITVSSPYAGIKSARTCSAKFASILTLGLNRLICRMISGGKWYEISERSHFIQEPGTLGDNVQRHLKIVTDEEGSCREYREDGSCGISDFVFTVKEQRFEKIDQDPRVEELLIKEGHGAVIQRKNKVSPKLLKVLRESFF